eukprot:5421538-Amphidinium_carterae.1
MLVVWRFCGIPAALASLLVKLGRQRSIGTNSLVKKSSNLPRLFAKSGTLGQSSQRGEFLAILSLRILLAQLVVFLKQGSSHKDALRPRWG